MEYAVVASSLFALILYWNTLGADFAYDDSRAIKTNHDVLADTSLFRLFLNDFWGTPLTHSGSHKSYRPLCVLSFRFNYWLGGLQPWGYHLVNVLLHTIVTGIFTKMAQIFLRDALPSAFAGLLFAAHPIHTEAVAGVVGRADIGACLFFLLSFVCYINYCKTRNHHSLHNEQHPSNQQGKKWPFLCGTILFATASMLTKEQGITVLGVCGLYDILIHTKVKFKEFIYILFEKKYRGLREGLLMLTVCLISLLSLRFYLMGNKPPKFAPSDNPAADSDDFLTRTLTFLYLPVVNFLLLLYPLVLSFDWSMDAIPLVTSLFDIRNICSATFYASLSYFVIYCYLNINHRKIDIPCLGNGHILLNINQNYKYCNAMAVQTKRKNGYHLNHTVNSPRSTLVPYQTLDILIISTAIIILPFIPASNLFFYVGFVIAERILYIPSMGWCLLLAKGIYIIYKKVSLWKRYLLLAGFGYLLITFSARTVIRNMDWLTEETLYRSGIEINPPKAWGNLANVLTAKGLTQEAELAYRKALQYRNNMADVYYNLGLLLQEQHRYQEAVDSYRMAIKCRPRMAVAHLNLGLMLNLMGKKEDAAEVYRHCSQLDGTGMKDPKTHENTKISALFNLGRLLADQAKYEEAIEVYNEAIRKMPAFYQPQSLYNMLGESYFKLDRLAEAEYWYKQALKSKPDHVPAHLTYAKLLHKTNRKDEAEDWFLKAIFLNSNESSVYQHYGQFLGESERFAEAAENYLKAAQLSPGEYEIVFNAANSLRQANKNEEAEHYYRLATQLRPTEATSHMNLGAMLHVNGKLHEAEQSYLAALRIKPDDVITQNNLQKLRSLMIKKGLKPLDTNS